MKKLYEEKSAIIFRLFIYQFAISLLGLFVSSPFKGRMLLFAGIFAALFYFSLIGYAVVEDGQKDCISAKAGRLDGSVFTGLKYALVSYSPTIILTTLHCILRFAVSNAQSNTLVSILNVIMRFFLMGMYLGIDSGLVANSYDAQAQKLVSTAPQWVQFMSGNGLFFLIFLVFMPLVCGVCYALAYKGKMHVNTQVRKK